MENSKTYGNSHKCGNCGTKGNCDYRWIYDTDCNGDEIHYKLYLCADCEAILDDEDDDDGGYYYDGRVRCGNCGELVYPDEDYVCPECGCNAYMM